MEQKLQEMTETQILIQDRIQKQKEDRNEEAFSNIMQFTGETKQEIQRKIKAINALGICKVTVQQYAKFELYKYEEDMLSQFLEKIKERNRQKKELEDLLEKVDQGALTYKDIERNVDAFYFLMGELLTDTFKKKITTPYREDLMIDDGTRTRIAVDVEISRFLLGFSNSEYYAFRFWEKDLREKREYLNGKERYRILRMLNDESSRDILKDKGKCYELLKDYYGRKLLKVESVEDADKLKAFCKRKKCFVKKPYALAQGKGIELIPVTPQTNYKELVEQLLGEEGKFIAEECIRAGHRMKRLNPDSVNTVRLETFYNGEKVEVVSGFLRVGQKGSFVDNGGAGGLGIAIDLSTGKLISDGIDEVGRICEKHPYTGINFKEYKLPRWEQALALVKEIGDKIPGASYVGWDVTFIRGWKWIVVEGNGMPQYIYNQSPLNKGLKKEFLNKFEK